MAQLNPSTNNPEKKESTGPKIFTVISIIIVYSVYAFIVFQTWVMSAKQTEIVNSNQISIVKIGTDAAIINFKTNSYGKMDFYVSCKYDKPQYFDGHRYETFCASNENLLKNGYNDLTFDLHNLKSGSSQWCYISFYGCDVISIPEFRTIPEPTVEMFNFYKKHPSTNKARIIGSLKTTNSTGLVWWVVYGTPTTPYEYTTQKSSIDNFKLEVDIDQPLDLTEEYKAKIIVEDACGKKYYSDSVIGQ